MRMYTRWAERNGYPVEVFDTSYAEEAGLKSATFAVHAPYAYGTLASRPAPTGWCGSARSTTRAAGRPRSPRSRWCRCSSRPTRSTSPTRTSASTSTARPARRPVRQHHRLRGPPDPHPDRHGRVLPEREVPAAEQGLGDGGPQGQAARAEEGRGEGPPRRAARRRAGLVGRPDAQLRAEPVPDRQGPAHRVRVGQPAGGASTARSTASSRPASAGAAAPSRPPAAEAGPAPRWRSARACWSRWRPARTRRRRGRAHPGRRLDGACTSQVSQVSSNSPGSAPREESSRACRSGPAGEPKSGPGRAVHPCSVRGRGEHRLGNSGHRARRRSRRGRGTVAGVHPQPFSCTTSSAEPVARHRDRVGRCAS